MDSTSGAVPFSVSTINEEKPTNRFKASACERIGDYALTEMMAYLQGVRRGFPILEAETKLERKGRTAADVAQAGSAKG